MVYSITTFVAKWFLKKKKMKIYIVKFFLIIIGVFTFRLSKWMNNYTLNIYNPWYYVIKVKSLLEQH